MNAWAFDLACSFRLLYFDNKREADKWAMILGSIFGTKEGGGQKVYPKHKDFEEL